MAATAAAANVAMASKESEQPPPPSSADVEMTNLPPTSSSAAPDSQPQQPDESDTTAGASPQAAEDSEAEPSHPKLTRLQSEAGLGPATDSPIAPPLPTADRGPVLSITLMLITGARHPYKIDEKYLRSRNVPSIGEESTANFDPREISGYKLKELIWTDWRTEWEARPASPSSIRLIILGRMVEDKAALKGGLTNHSTYVLWDVAVVLICG